MKWTRTAVPFLLLTVLSANAGAQSAQRYPSPSGQVNDFAQLLKPAQQQQLESLLREVLAKTRTSVVVATFKSLNGIDENTAATEIFEQWGIGDKETDKGVLFLISVQDRRMRIETGYGVEGILPDAKAGRLLDQFVVPHFKKGDYAAGILQGSLALTQIIAADAGVELGAPMPRAPPQQAEEVSPLGALLRFLILIPLVILFWRNPSLFFFLMLSGMGSGSRRYGGGGFGGGGFGGGGFGGGLSGGGGASRGW